MYVDATDRVESEAAELNASVNKAMTIRNVPLHRRNLSGTFETASDQPIVKVSQ